MNDVFSRMIARTSSSLSPLQPVLASRYEPTAMPEIPAPVEQTKTVETTQLVSPRMAETPQRRNTPQLETHSPTTTRVKPREDDDKDAGKPGRTRPVEKLETAAIVRTGDTAAPRPERGLQVERRKAGEQSAASGLEIRDKEIRADIIAARTVTKAIEQESGREERPSVAAPSIEPAAATEPPSPMPAAPAEVKVTIGTIEVRVAGPARPAPRKGPPPRVSLDDYLRQRNGGPR